MAATYAKKTDIPATPDLSGYAKTSDIPSLEGYAKKTDIPAAPDLSGYAKTSDIPSLEGYAKKTDIPDLTDYAKTADIPTVPEKLSDLTVDKIGDMPMTTVNLNLTNVDGVATVKFLGKTITASGTTTYRIPAYSPVYISVEIGEGKENYSYYYTFKVNGKEITDEIGEVYGVSREEYKNNRWDNTLLGGTTNMWSTFVESGIDNYNIPYEQVSLRFVPLKVYSSNSGKTWKIIKSDNDNKYDGERTWGGNIVNQVIGPFDQTENNINIVVTKSNGPTN